ncbi:hypothetical protein [Nonomuraea zeae]|uniref:Exo-alpha-sialidase n=1 Tax=Nonomuraea zeae TaxID=1642303 RepID=A0A5S4F3Z9_9ACTN|nr:hypothetical protein [Nonomuraea zeae]TMR10771.1 hypothetical protein ETD85_60090 [Nonomuraea zeae]
MRTPRLTRGRLRRATTMAGLTTLITGVVAAGPLTPAGAAGPLTPAGARPGCTPAWTMLPAASVDTTVVDVDVIAPNDVRFTENLAFAAVRTLRWDGKTLAENGPQIPIPPRTSQYFEAGAGSYDSAGNGWAITRMHGMTRPDGASSLARWAGGRWTLTPSAPSSDPSVGAASVADVASPAPDRAWAVGQLHGVGYQAFIERWDGTEWTMADHPATGYRVSALSAVRAWSADDVWAVGYRQDAGPYQPLVLHDDGTGWKESPLPDIGPSGRLTTIGGTGPDDVWIGGFSGTEYESAPLLLHWDGKSWSAQPTPAPGPHGTEIQRLYAAAPGDLWAIAYDSTQNHGLRLTHWDGTSWQDVKPQGSQPPAYGFDFYEVDGSGPGDVWVVGATTFTEPSDGAYPYLRSRRLIAHLSCGRK